MYIYKLGAKIRTVRFCCPALIWTKSTKVNFFPLGTLWRFAGPKIPSIPNDWPHIITHQLAVRKWGKKLRREKTVRQTIDPVHDGFVVSSCLERGVCSSSDLSIFFFVKGPSWFRVLFPNLWRKSSGVRVRVRSTKPHYITHQKHLTLGHVGWPNLTASYLSETVRYGRYSTKLGQKRLGSLGCRTLALERATAGRWDLMGINEPQTISQRAESQTRNGNNVPRAKREIGGGKAQYTKKYAVR